MEHSIEQAEPVIVVGGGLAGLATALGVALGGRKAVVLEASALIGGAAAYSGGQVWCGANHVEQRLGIEDSLGLAQRYVRAIGDGDPSVRDEGAMIRWLTTAPVAMKYWEDVGAIRWTVIPELADYHGEADGALAEGRYLTNEVIDGKELGPWRELLRVSPYFPVGTTYADMFIKGRRLTYVDENDEIAQHAGVPAFGLPDRHASQMLATSEGADPLTFGTGVVASFLAKVLKEDAISILASHPVTALIKDGDAVVGATAAGPDGVREFRGPVVLATSTYDWDPDLVREFLGLEPEDFGSVAPHSLRGDGIKLARSVGGAIARIPANAVPILPGWRSTLGSGYSFGPEYAMPHSMIVDSSGNRYCDDSYWVDIVGKTLDPDDMHLPFFLIWDEQHHQKYGLGVCGPGEPYPEGLVTSAGTLPDLGAALGIDGATLTATAARFSAGARIGEDAEWGRGTNAYARRYAGDPANKPNPVLGPIVQSPFHGLRLKFIGTGIGSSGVHTDGDGRVLNGDGGVLDGLYAVGSCAAMTTTGIGYNSGFALGRGITLAYLVSQALTGNPVARVEHI